MMHETQKCILTSNICHLENVFWGNRFWWPATCHFKFHALSKTVVLNGREHRESKIYHLNWRKLETKQKYEFIHLLFKRYVIVKHLVKICRSFSFLDFYILILIKNELFINKYNKLILDKFVYQNDFVFQFQLLLHFDTFFQKKHTIGLFLLLNKQNS